MPVADSGRASAIRPALSPVREAEGDHSSHSDLSGLPQAASSPPAPTRPAKGPLDPKDVERIRNWQPDRLAGAGVGPSGDTPQAKGPRPPTAPSPMVGTSATRTPTAVTTPGPSGAGASGAAGPASAGSAAPPAATSAAPSPAPMASPDTAVVFSMPVHGRHTPSAAPPHVASSTPSSAVGGDTCFTVNGKVYRRLEALGKGGSSKVYKVMSEEGKILALKRIKLKKADRATLQAYKNEIDILSSLSGKENIIQMVDSHMDLENKLIYVVMESGEIVLSKWLQRQQDRVKRLAGQAPKADSDSEEEDGTPVVAPTCAVEPNMLRMIWMQMLNAVQTIHDARIIHGDLKSANFVFVEGTLKLIDFGIARTIGNDTTNIVRDSQVGTLNYMAPEALSWSSSCGSRVKMGRASDVWSLGCILYQMVYGATPFASITNVVHKIRAIADATHVINFPKTPDAALVDVMMKCLHRDPTKRPTITGLTGLLNHPFLHPERLSTMMFSALSPESRDDVNVAAKEAAALVRAAQAHVALATAAPAPAACPAPHPVTPALEPVLTAPAPGALPAGPTPVAGQENPGAGRGCAPSGCGPSGPRRPLMLASDLKSEIAKGARVLKPVDPSVLQEMSARKEEAKQKKVGFEALLEEKMQHVHATDDGPSDTHGNTTWL